MTVLNNSIMSLIERTHNPLNIRYNPVNKWLGQTGEFHGFCCFESDEYGYRAALVLLTNYIKRGLLSIDSIVARFAPATENATDNYIKYVKQVFNDYYFVPDFTVNPFMTLYFLVRGMAFMETLSHIDLNDFRYIYKKYNIHERIL